MLFRPRIHESIAFSGMFSAGISLHLFWIVNLLAQRLPFVAELLMFSDAGYIFGLYLVGFFTFVIAFVLLLTLLRGRDLSDHREHAFWFFLVSVVIYLVMTFPSIFLSTIIA